ncbi:General negative regulator of transcription subunit like [Actinidia chinensis var. chinensis]|uniref:General negative regulator of transcription subunit like n=1 Tax=Actinidia chinensis var. chinensis TaxID=1590841 RepID=A0A2R6PUD4_ACTCC|nr:General negative regulator of transcription subunit like [Actinidia chinensis var. chinensis]
MVTDSITNASIPMATSNPKDFAKKKRANRSAKLKQCKLDARREQWLSQVKNKGCKEEADGLVHARDASEEPRREKREVSIHHYSDSDSPSNSPTSPTSSVLGSNSSGTNFTGSSRGSSSSSSSGGSCSGSVAGEDDDGCLDDWEAVADALVGTDDKQQQSNPSSDPPLVQLGSHPELGHRKGSGVEISRPNLDRVEKVQRATPNSRAWKPDDAFRPESLPNLSKQHSLPMNSGRQYGCGGGVWVCKKVISAPSSCPICCEDLDLTDSSFLPCSCGFRLCLFCHKRILEDDGRCPGCRKQYEYEPVKGEASLDGGSVTFRLARSCSMITRS